MHSALSPLVRSVRRTLGPVHWNRLKLRMGRFDRNGYYDALTEEVMRRWLRPDSVCVDVGCHTGQLLRTMMRHAPEGRFYAFEPIPALHRALADGFRDPRVRVFPYALSDRAGSSTFNHVLSNPGYSGLVRRRYDRPHEDDTTIVVETARLDDLVVADDRVRLIKIDVEGAELLVLRGAEGVIGRDRPLIVFEHGPGGADCYGTGPDDVYDLLSRHGLRVQPLDDWLRGRAPLTRAEFAGQFASGANWYFVAAP
jgi:FkbM family methyltransferase